MRRFVVLALLGACSAKAPSGAPPAEAPRSTPQLASMDDPPSVPASTPPAATDPREAALAHTVTRLLEEDHLLHRKLDDAVSRAAFDAYMERLDGDKMFLLKSDRDALGHYADKIDDEMHAGNLELAHLGEKTFLARIDAVDKMIQELLASPLNHDDDEWVETDPKKLQPAATDDELRDRWRKRLELQVLERVGQMEDRLDKKKKAAAEDKLKKKKPAETPPAAGSDEEEDRTLPVAEIPATPEAREEKARTDLAKQYASRFARLHHPQPLDAAADLVNAVASTFDPHTDYLPPADKENFDIHMTGTLQGIGASLRERDHYIEVVELVPGGAAWKHGGLAPGDLILAVQNTGKDPVDVVDMRLDDVVSMIRGPTGTVVRLRIQKPDGHEESLAITRDVVEIAESYARAAVLTRKAGPSFGYIHLPAFYGGPSGARTASADVRRLLGELNKRKVAGVVLDIRSNGGGLLQDAVRLTGEFIDKGPVVQVRDSEGHREVLPDEDKGEDFDGPLIVLVDRFSASASEILAGALQDYHRAVIVGTGPTHGKGTVQTLIDLDRVAQRKEDLGDLKMTIEQFFRVSGASTQLEGVTPDIVLPDPAGYLDTGERKLEHAIAWSKIQPVPHDDWAVTWKVPALVVKSAARVAKNPLLSKIAAANTLLRSEREDTRIPLARSAWEARHKQLQTALEGASPDLVHAPPAFSVVLVDGDSSTPAPPPGPGVKADDRPARWRDALARDPWIDECVAILGDMAGK
jgi:carboxyl-terminal processing protease